MSSISFCVAPSGMERILSIAVSKARRASAGMSSGVPTSDSLSARLLGQLDRVRVRDVAALLRGLLDQVEEGAAEVLDRRVGRRASRGVARVVGGVAAPAGVAPAATGHQPEHQQQGGEDSDGRDVRFMGLLGGWGQARMPVPSRCLHGV